MVYVYVNGELTRAPESTADSESTDGLACPNCGTAFRYDTAGRKYLHFRTTLNWTNLILNLSRKNKKHWLYRVQFFGGSKVPVF